MSRFKLVSDNEEFVGKTATEARNLLEANLPEAVYYDEYLLINGSFVLTKKYKKKDKYWMNLSNVEDACMATYLLGGEVRTFKAKNSSKLRRKVNELSLTEYTESVFNGEIYVKIADWKKNKNWSRVRG